MKRSIAILFVVLQLSGCKDISSPPMKSNLINFKTFAQLCETENSGKTAQKSTVAILLERAETKDCKQAEVKLKSLENLDLFNEEIVDLEPLAHFTNLVSLDLMNNNIIDIRPLQGLTNLVFLGLSKNKISNVTPLANMKKLVRLSLANNQIKNVESLSTLAELDDLNLMENKNLVAKCPLEVVKFCQF
jgi:internalin A